MNDKMAICKKFISRGLPLVKLDEKFLFYSNIVDQLQNTLPYHDIGPIRVNLQSLIESICEHAIDWKNTLGQILAERTLGNILELRNHMKVGVCFVACRAKAVLLATK